MNLSTILSCKPTRFMCIINNCAKNGYLKYSSQSSNHYDIIIAGGGMVGTTLACTLGQNTKLANKRILLLEGGKVFKWKLEERYSNRVSALNPSTVDLFTNMGVWKHIAEVRYAPVKKMQVWDAVSDAMITFNNDDLSEAIAYIVENDVLLAAVGKEVKKLPNVTVVNEAIIKSYQFPNKPGEMSKVDLENGFKYTCNLLVSKIELPLI